MDNPQHYQPLSHALHPPLASPGLQPATLYPTQHVYRLKPVNHHHEEDDGSDDNDEGAVHDLIEPHDDSNPPSPHTRPTGYKCFE